MTDKKTYMRDYMRTRRFRFRAAGLCPMCGREPAPGRKACPECIKKQRAANVRYKARNGVRA